MSSASFDFAPLLPAGLPPAAARWTGRVKFDFTGGNNDADSAAARRADRGRRVRC